MAGPVIRVQGLSKQYRIARRRGQRTLGEELTEAVRAPFRWLAGRGRPADGAQPGGELFWALKDVTFDMQAGEVLGIIGGNGAGKSTLLKILSRIVAPTAGGADIRGRIGSLLEVGTGFHPELTGRENVFMNGAMLGMRRVEIVRKFDEIVEFADIGSFLDTPVKRYSSGMQVRLAFAVAAHLEPEVLIVDEVLAVGDAQFQMKCLGKMQDVSRGAGRTVLFVSHNMDAVQRLCGRALLLERGRATAMGETNQVVARYLTHARGPSSPGEWIDLHQANRTGSGAARVTAARYRSELPEAGDQPYPDGPLLVDLALQISAPCTVASLALTLYDLHGTKLVNADTIALGRTLRFDLGEHRLSLRIAELHLNPGVYTLGLWVAGPHDAVLDSVPAAFDVEVVTVQAPGLGRAASDDGLVTSRLELLDAD